MGELMGKRYNRDTMSESQSDALYRRDHTYTEASGQSFTVAWNYRNRTPTSLAAAEQMVRQAYADEVVLRLHEGYDSIGEGGTPKMTPRFEAYLDDRDDAGSGKADPVTGERPLIDEFKTPFRGTLASYERSRARIIFRVAVAGERPIQAVISEGVPAWCARLVAEDTIFGFLRNLSDVKVHLPKRQPEAA